jgi:predicted ferric reductase
MFWQIILGAYMQKWTEKFGGWVLRFHINEGVAIYLLVLLHPFFFMLYRYFAGAGLDPFYIFTQVCVLCVYRVELYYSLGRVSFWLINITVFAGLFRLANPYMRANWKKFHVLNYLVFLLVGIHGFLIGTDFMVMPFFAFAIAAYLIVIYTIIRKLPGLYSFLKNWLKA